MICIPLKHKSSTQLLKKIKEAQGLADLLEIHFDQLKIISDKTLKQIFKSTNLPILYKSLGQKDKLEKVLKYRPAYLDLDLKTSHSLINLVRKISPKTKLILSHHDFEKTPSSKILKALVGKMRKKGADICKIATSAKNLADSFRILELLSEESPKSPCIFIAMGRKGRISRLTGHLFGNYLMYAPLDKKSSTANGQIPAKELKQILCHLK
ncbi:type I 3-dehydroquinate dehydratase [Patescibacteria group bacterium]|nr:type I 3-dehydroquinate dehydratase [Patescibacteria group bacterium]